MVMAVPPPARGADPIVCTLNAEPTVNNQLAALK